ncbi:hypothetical protein W97_06685 [Coniosporium apollinis CBS 100218]|uniref:NADP-dependent oxidoreductase domain-containing protein n=1 Tax=Coniosporium apollinis (strain CBS 100218) TaxID=1168221 RepID=R7YZV2_CONA1|nr:uncharacterized protein W97_06685 [Coniosporium apollinis CBS 100218]EON67432.1 hypothetical protein W97_06685 [Coniosporium apollinis CBS 100218]
MPQITGKNVGSIGYGLMGLTWRANPPSQTQSFAAMRTALSLGANFWNGGELYGTPERNSLHLLNEYFTERPDDADKVVLSIKGGLKPGEMAPDGSEKNVRRSIDECLRVLDGKKFLDIFECARVDPATPIETTVGAIAEYVKVGKVGGVGLSEVSAETIRRAAKVTKIAAVEVEFSLWATDILENGIAEACAELNIPIVAYSPLGRGFLTGQIKSPDDIPDDDFRKHMPRFQPDVFDQNMELVRQVEQLASKKKCTSGQVALAWIKAQSGKDGNPVLIPIPGATTEERIKENMKDVELNEDDLAEIKGILSKVTITGGRY